jgi:aspartyl/asparaginyl beta-hydroxylase (cupin superfamily)
MAAYKRFQDLYTNTGMNKQILEDYRISYNIDAVIDLLSIKGDEVIDFFPSDTNYINNSNIDVLVEPNKLCDMRTLIIYDSTHSVSDNLKNFFRQELDILKLIPNLQRAIYTFVSPRSVVPKHADDDDPYFRMIYGVLTPSNDFKDVGLVIENHEIYLGIKDVIGVKSDVVHWGWNNTDTYWSVLVLCIEDKKLDELRKIY